MEFPQKLKTELPDVPATPLLGMYPERTFIQEDRRASVFTAVSFTVAKTQKQTVFSRWREKEDVVYYPVM